MKAVRKTIITLCLLMLSVGLFAQQKPRLAVLKVDNQTSTWHTELGPALENYLVEEFLATGKFRVMERQQINAVLGEQAMGLSGTMDLSTAADVGKVLGVQLMVVGNVSQLDVKKSSGSGAFGVGFSGSSTKVKGTFSIRLINTATAELVFAKSYSSEAKFGKMSVAGFGGGTDFDESKVKKIFSKTVKDAVADINSKSEEIKDSIGANAPLEGKIAKVSGEKFYINIGKTMGVNSGDEFGVFRIVDEIIDPETGDVLGREEEKVGTIMVTKVVNDKLSMGVAQGGSGFAEGDLVRRVPKADGAE